MTASGAAAKRIGQVLDEKWRLTELIGEGGMASVYGACHIRNGGSVAIKILTPATASDVALAVRFLTEGYVANRVGHKGCVRVLDDGRAPDGTPYIVMERLNGSTLDALANMAALPAHDVLRYGIALAEVLAAAHAAGIIHRDIKPENLFLCDDGTVKVLDFGIAHLKGFAQEARITVAGQTLGTPAFMPPEQVMGKWDCVGPASDVYAAGGTLFNLLTGTFPQPAETAQEFMVRTATQQARPVRSVRPDVPAPLAAVIDRALAHEIEDRYQDGAALLDALRAVARGEMVETPIFPIRAAMAATGENPRVTEPKSPARLSTAPVSTLPRPRGARSWMVPSIMGVIALAAIGAVAVIYVQAKKPLRASAASSSAEIPVTLEAPAGATSGGAIAKETSPAPTVTPSETPPPPSESATAAVRVGPLHPTASPHGPPAPTSQVATARPHATAAPAQRPTAPDPADPLGFH